MRNRLGIPRFKTYEELLSSSWLAIRVATVTVAIIAFQSKKVIETFSLYEGITVWVHSILFTGVTAFAILHFTVKLSKVPKNSQDNKKIKRQLGGLIMLFSFVEFLLSVGYHILWMNIQQGQTMMAWPGWSFAFVFTLFLDTLLPVTLYFYGHTVHIKTQAEIDILRPAEPTQAPESPFEVGSKLVVSMEGFDDKTLTVKEIQKPPQEEVGSNSETSG